MSKKTKLQISIFKNKLDLLINCLVLLFYICGLKKNKANYYENFKIEL